MSVGSFGPSVFFQKIWRTRWLRWAFNAVVMLLVALSLVQKIKTMLDLDTALTQPAHPGPVVDNFEKDIQALLTASLFGETQTFQEERTAVPPTSLNMVLRGVVTSKDSGMAFISVEGKPDEMYVHGQKIIPGVTLAAVHKDSVVLTRNGKLETLILAGAELVQDIQVTANGMTSVVKASPSSRGTSDKPIMVSRASLRNQVQSPHELLSQAVLVPNAGGGFLIKEVQPGSLVEQYGLRAGDVVHRSNGQILTYADDIRRAYEQLANASQLKLEFSRGGKWEELNFELR